ncbi:MAG: Maf family nucleotide pyrophosphatase, partial [Actinomycetota bacterium]|nr:Maf family nucleotide pyrophosphatase [Actinomycetota bacterium]
MSVPPAPPLLLASTSPQRRAILHQLGIPFDAVAPRYEEHDPPEADAEQLVCEHAVGKARSVLDQADDRPVLGVDTTVVLGGRLYAKAKNAGEAERMLEELSGRTHAVVSGLCLATPAWEVVSAIATRVTFRKLTPRDLATYVASGEWE